MRHNRLRRPHARREGAVMIVVMLLLLSVTALAVFSIHATTFEMRAAGHARQGMQVQYVSEAGLTSALALVDRMGPAALLNSIAESSRLGIRPSMQPFEPDLAADKEGYRMYLGDFAGYADDMPVDRSSLGDSGGARQPYEPNFIVDVNDQYSYTGVIAGQRSDGYGDLRYLHATYTSRGRMRLSAGDYTGTSGVDPREYHEAANDARAQGVSGPFGQ